MGWALPAGDTTPRPGTEAYLAKGLEEVHALPAPPMAVLARLREALQDENGHFHAFVLLTDEAGCTLGQWWTDNRDSPNLRTSLEAIFSAALFRARLYP